MARSAGSVEEQWVLIVSERESRPAANAEKGKEEADQAARGGGGDRGSVTDRDHMPGLPPTPQRHSGGDAAEPRQIGKLRAGYGGQLNGLPKREKLLACHERASSHPRRGSCSHSGATESRGANGGRNDALRHRRKTLRPDQYAPLRERVLDRRNRLSYLYFVAVRGPQAAYPGRSGTCPTGQVGLFPTATQCFVELNHGQQFLEPDLGQRKFRLEQIAIGI